jgi:hypothetical protein
MESPGTFGNRLISRLRVGSVLSTPKGKSYRVIEPLVQVAPNRASPSRLPTVSPDA